MLEAVARAPDFTWDLELEMTNVFELLGEIRRRPSLYLDADEEHRFVQLRCLEHMLRGYALALSVHGIEEPVGDFNRGFIAYLREVKGWGAEFGWVNAIQRAVGGDEEKMWDWSWKLIDEYRESLRNV
ncbi:hypothetical protein HJC22_06510 [Corallococcus exiguus]|uniref:hypothetical protein n=1 Tax=Corallococcus TaxID=83461 RepID=UPI000EE055FE|nr:MULTISPECIES: hypothetical protein [Corallococcus]NNC15379.1 hypothetical protein [Corallococcus exiguus]RKI14025.1 hypothetical protein D7Y15_15620 [Corallococcus sp. AB030]RUO90484.1 hypothetical protein D7Y11_24920 [Corallococcus sp. AB018]